MRDALAGVLCRCTGYRKIVEAVLAVAARRGRAAPPAPRRAGGRRRAARLDAPAKVDGSERFGADALAATARRPRCWRCAWSARRTRTRAFELGDLAALRARWPGLVDVAHRRRRAEQRVRDLSRPARPAGARRRRGALPRRGGARARRRRADACSAIADAERADPLRAARRARCRRRQRSPRADGAARRLHARSPDNVLCRGRVVRGDVDARARRRQRIVAERDLRDRATSSTPTSSPRPATPRSSRRATATARRCAGSASSPARRRPTWTATRSRTCWRSRRSRCTSCRRRSAAASAASSTSRCSRCSRSPPGSSAGAVRLVYERPESMQSSTKRHPARMRARAACDADGRLVAFDFSGDFNTGAYSSWGPTVANRVPIHASGPYRVAARARADPRRAHPQQRRRRVPRLRRAAVDAARRAADRRARGAQRASTRSSSATATRCVAGDATPTGQVLAASVGLRACLDALRPAWAAATGGGARASTTEAQREQARPLRRGAGIACMWYGIGNTVIANPSTMRGACAGAPSAAPISSSTTARRRSARAPRRSCRRCSPTRSACRWRASSR